MNNENNEQKKALTPIKASVKDILKLGEQTDKQCAAFASNNLSLLAVSRADVMANPELQALYFDQHTTAIKKAIHSILAACYIQKRAVFLLSRRSVERLVKEDKNWQHVAWSDQYYKGLILNLEQSGYASRITAGNAAKRLAALWQLDAMCESFVGLTEEEANQQRATAQQSAFARSKQEQS
jgi:hypothetical protein